MSPVDRIARRRLLARVIGGALGIVAAAPRSGRTAGESAARESGAGAPSAIAIPERRWYEAAVSMQRLAESWGDQSYGAVLVLDGRIIGEGPSRVVQRADATAHAEREAIRDAQRRTGRERLAGSVLYSTSRPCASCERAAAAAGVGRMVYGEALIDAGRPVQ